jgi:hypothetical protein
MTFRAHLLVLLPLAGLFGCDAAAPSPAAADRAQQPVGKADAIPGSCEHDGKTTCGGPSNGACWCDEMCGEFGDCCADAQEICGVDACQLANDHCPAGTHCTEHDDGNVCVADEPEPEPGCGALRGEATFDCPDGWRLAPNHAGLAFCLRENLTVGPDVTAACDTGAGVVGYVDPAATSCPADAAAVQGSDGLTCSWDVEVPEDGADAYCHWIEMGYLGFSWTACPALLDFEMGDANEQRCVGRTGGLPVGAQAYCDYVADGYLGYSWTIADDPSHVCPGGTRQTDNGAGLGFCLVEGFQVPGLARPYCDAQAGIFGFEWMADC